MIDSQIHVLILEDSDEDFQLIETELKKSGREVKVRRAVNGKDFESCLRNRLPDVVLSEVKAGAFGIDEVIGILKANNFQGPVIVVTDLVDDYKAVDLVSDLDIDDCLLKDNLFRLRLTLNRELKNNRNEQLLKERNKILENLSLVASHTHNGVIITCKEKRIEWVNKAFTKMTGYSLDEIKGEFPGDFLQGEDTDPKTVSRISKKLRMKVPFSEEIINYKKDGNPYVVKLEITPIFDDKGGIEKYISIQENVTERFKTENELLESNKRFQEAQRVAKIGDWSYHLEQNIVEWSAEMYRIYDRPRSLGPPSFQEFMDMTDSNGSNEIKETVLYSIKSLTAYDLVLKINVPETKHIRIIGKPKTDDDGNIEKLAGTVQDITTLKRTEAKLKEKSELLDHIINNLNATVFRFVLKADGSGEILYLNDSMSNHFGIGKIDVFHSVKDIFQSVHKEDSDPLYRSIMKSSENLTSWDHTWRHLLDDGSTVYLRGKGMPVKQKNGSIYWDSIILDETQHVIEEKRKKELENLLTDSLDEIFIFDAESLKFIYCNNSALTNIGYTMKELKQLTPLAIKPGFTKEAFNDLLEQARSESNFRFETIHKRKNSSTYYVLINLRFARYLNKDVFVAHTQDISKFKEAEEKLNLFKTRTDMAVEAAEVGIWELNLKTMDTFFNELYYKMLGYSENDVTFNKSFHDSVIHPDDALIIEGHMKKIFREQITGFEETIRMKHKDGEYRWILDKARIIERDENGKPVILAGTHLDVTEIVETIEEKNVLIQEVHHRVKNNLAIISGLIDLEMIKKEKMDDKSLLNTQKRIKAIATVHEQLYQTENFSEIIIDDYFKSLIEKIKATLFEDDHSISINYSCNVKAININQAVPLGLLLNELISNSVKYGLTDMKGSIVIHINQTVEGTISFYYEDSGYGIDEKVVDITENFGFDLIRTLIGQLSDEHNLDTRGVFKLQFNFKKKEVGAYSNLRNSIN